jgi:thiol:disulfide interchange protein DsbC
VAALLLAGALLGGPAWWHIAQADVPSPAPAPAPAPVAPAVDQAAEAPPPCPSSMSSASASVPLAPLNPAVLAQLRQRLKPRLGDVTSICRTPFGLLEVIVDGEFFYVDERANFLLTGNAFDLRTQENITATRKEEVFRVDFNTLPFDKAIRTVRGDGKRLLAIFEDPNCPYCKRFEKDLSKLDNATIYTFLYPILSRDKAKAEDSYPRSRAIWCAPDRAHAWAQIMLDNQRLADADAACDTPLEDNLKLGKKLHVTGTPTLIFTDGRRAPGAIPLDQVEKMIAEASAGKPATAHQ